MVDTMCQHVLAKWGMVVEHGVIQVRKRHWEGYQYTHTCNFIAADMKSMAFPIPIFRELTNATTAQCSHPLYQISPNGKEVCKVSMQIHLSSWVKCGFNWTNFHKTHHYSIHLYWHLLYYSAANYTYTYCLKSCINKIPQLLMHYAIHSVMICITFYT